MPTRRIIQVAVGILLVLSTLVFEATDPQVNRQIASQHSAGEQ